MSTWNYHLVELSTTAKSSCQQNNYTSPLMYIYTKNEHFSGNQQYAEQNPVPLFAAELPASENPC